MNILFSIIKLLPAIIQVVQSLEALLPQSGAGKAKLAIAQEVLGAAYDEASGASKDMPKERWLTIATNLICKVVGIFNLHGIFKKSPAPSAA
jgi:hypothetical protein